jgi:hypothetical protein
VLQAIHKPGGQAGGGTPGPAPAGPPGTSNGSGTPPEGV